MFYSKKSHKDFHESYYEHRCAVIDVKDILQTDIWGETYMSKFKRWWYGLFLLSYSDDSSKTFFPSTQAMRTERIRHFRKYRSRIHPFSKFRLFQEICMFILFIMNKIVFHHNTSLAFNNLSIFFYYFGALVELIIIADVFINMQTGYVDNEARVIILGIRDGLLHYGSTKLFLHVASAIPLQCIMFLRYGNDINCSLCKTNKFMLVLQILSIFRLLRIYEYSRYLTREKKNYKLTHFFKLMRILTIGFMTMLQYLDLTDMITLMCMISSGHIEDGTYVSELIHIKYALTDTPTNSEFFYYNVARICKSFILFSFNTRRRKFRIDIMFSLFAYIIAKLFNIWLIIECFNLILRMSFCEDRVLRFKQEVDNMVCHRQLPDTVARKIDKYFDCKQSQMKCIERANHLYNSLPETLKKETFLSMHMRFIKRIPYFNEWPENVIESVVVMLKKEIYLNNEMVAEPAVQSEGLFVVATGELAVYNGDIEVGHLIDGDYFGELSLVTDKEVRTSSVIAINHCVMLFLEKTAFRYYMRDYEDLFSALKQELMDSYDVDKSTIE